jgi:hypothetical protein
MTLTMLMMRHPRRSRDDPTMIKRCDVSGVQDIYQDQDYHKNCKKAKLESLSFFTSDSLINIYH